jgi:hypothetical protein
MTHTLDATTEYPLVYRNLMAVGLLGAVYKSGDDAAAVNEAVELTLADPTQFRLCRAIAQGLGGDAASVSATLNRHLEAHGDDDSAKVAMAVALMLAGDTEWRPLIDNVLATSTDQVARAAATGVLEYVGTLAPKQ